MKQQKCNVIKRTVKDEIILTELSTAKVQACVMKQIAVDGRKKQYDLSD